MYYQPLFKLGNPIEIPDLFCKGYLDLKRTCRLHVLGLWGKPEYLEKTHVSIRRTYKLYTERLKVWGSNPASSFCVATVDITELSCFDRDLIIEMSNNNFWKLYSPYYLYLCSFYIHQVTRSVNLQAQNYA